MLKLGKTALAQGFYKKNLTVVTHVLKASLLVFPLKKSSPSYGTEGKHPNIGILVCWIG
jgi:hypothetical protein